MGERDDALDAALARAAGYRRIETLGGHLGWWWNLDTGTHATPKPPRYTRDLLAALSLRHVLRERDITLYLRTGPHGTRVHYQGPGMGMIAENLPADASDADIARAIATAAVRALGVAEGE